MSTPPAAEYRADAQIATRIVGLGASAGGLGVLEQFLANVPAASGLAYIVVQHLDPTHKAMLAELLQRSTAMPVQEAVQSMRVHPDNVYVIPPNSELAVRSGKLEVSPPSQPRGTRLPINVLFSSLARDQGERAIGVVLSGMGSDGTLGSTGHQIAGRSDLGAVARIGAIRCNAQERYRGGLRRYRRPAGRAAQSHPARHGRPACRLDAARRQRREQCASAVVDPASLAPPQQA